MIKKLFMTIVISTGTFSCLFAQTSSENDSKVVVKDENPQRGNDQGVQNKAVTSKEQYYLQPANRKKDLKAKNTEKKKATVKNRNSEMKDENDNL